MTRSRVRGPRAIAAPTVDDDVDDCVFVRFNKSDRSREASERSTLSRKDAQLCKQVLVAVQTSLAEWRADPILGNVEIVEAVPWPRLSRIRLTALAPADAESLVRDALDRARPFLRASVAAAISRKRTPGLVFLVLPYAGGGADA
ncbi:MAG: hypothetical protein JNM94_17255 [Phycisphaerae bacterium]|nr:hypothetical protein [Phycisphaerae bacterium]